MDRMTSIQTELWVDRPAFAISFYEHAFGAVVVHLVGDGDDIVAQLAIGEALFWVATSAADAGRFTPSTMGGATSRTLIIVEDPDGVVRQAVHAGAQEKSSPADEHGWRIGRILDPFGHEWEVAKPLGAWPPER
jgi:PhnB protein